MHAPRSHSRTPTKIIGVSRITYRAWWDGDKMHSRRTPYYCVTCFDRAGLGPLDYEHRDLDSALSLARHAAREGNVTLDESLIEQPGFSPREF